MIQQCDQCKKWFEDVFRNLDCPHDAFPANDGKNNFFVYEDAYLSDDEPVNKFAAHV